MLCRNSFKIDQKAIEPAKDRGKKQSRLETCSSITKSILSDHNRVSFVFEQNSPKIVVPSPKMVHPDEFQDLIECFASIHFLP